MSAGVIALCPRCSGWTMFHVDAEGDTGREWTHGCRKAGDIIVTGEIETLRSQMTAACVSADKDADRRNCEVLP